MRALSPSIRTALRRATCASTLVLSLACTPLGPFPGGRLDGPLAAPPADWTTLRPYGTVQLESHPGEPYSVNVWGTAVEDAFVVACRPTSRWLDFVRRDSRVRLRIHGSVYELRATIDARPELRERFFASLERDYDWAPSATDRAQAVLLRLERRR